MVKLFWKGCQDHSKGKGKSLQQWCWENWISTCKRMKLDPYLTPYTKVYSKWIKGDFPGGAVVKNLPANAGDMGSSHGLGRSHVLQSQ